MLRKIDRKQVELGMFVVGFGGTWMDHPFWRKRFHIESEEDLKKVAQSRVPYVLVDESAGRTSGLSQRPDQNGAPQPVPQSADSKHVSRPLFRPPDPNDPIIMARRKAEAIKSRARDTISQLLDDLKLGWAIDARSVNGLIDDITETVMEDARALLSVTRLKSKDDYTYLHSVAVCTLMVCIAVHRGMSPEEVRDLGLAGLLHDVGKVGVPDDVLNKPGKLTEEEFALARDHAEHGYQLLCESPGISETPLDVCRHHHERIDGTGYPFGLAQGEISFAARLGAVCDVFDALTSQRCYKEAWTAQGALTEMMGWEGHFDSELLFDLMHVLHVYPAGLLVRLEDGRLGLTLTLEQAGSHVPLIAFELDDAGHIARPQRLFVARRDEVNCIVAVENPAQLGIADWSAAQDQIKAAV